MKKLILSFINGRKQKRNNDKCFSTWVKIVSEK